MRPATVYGKYTNYDLKSENPFRPGSRILHTLDGSDPRLQGGVVSKTAQVSLAAVTLTETSVVKAHVEYQGDWSALNESTFLIGTQPANASNVIVSQVYYHPGPATEAEREAGLLSSTDFEYLAITNLLEEESVSLRGVQIHCGVRFDFDQAMVLDLEPNETAFLVKNPAGFNRREVGRLVLGSYQGNLSNRGETLQLTDSQQQVIFTLRYDVEEAWP